MLGWFGFGFGFGFVFGFWFGFRVSGSGNNRELIELANNVIGPYIIYMLMLCIKKNKYYYMSC